jgi:alkylresorcinol/alkylpyrone synthase
LRHQAAERFNMSASTCFRLDKLTKANIVATALSGDGAAACALRAGEAGIAVVETGGQHT